jgi:ureidoglycolate dehydrogenase (NAD+)
MFQEKRGCDFHFVPSRTLRESQTGMAEQTQPYPLPLLVERCRARLEKAGVGFDWARAAARAMLHASRYGIDSHGFRLTANYCRMISSGQVNPKPELKVKRTAPAAALIDADHGLGHYPSYEAMELACSMAAEAGIGAVGVYGSSHNGAAGAYALAGAEAGFVALSSTNTGAVVALHGSTAAFHGTNPIAAAAPVPRSQPWLLDMATSSIPLNRVLLYRVLGKELPPDTAADGSGNPAMDPSKAEMLLPLGGTDFSFKGAGLAGLVTVLCAALTGGTLDPDMTRMSRTESSQPRNCGHFFFALNPAHFAGANAFGQAMLTYLSALRATPAKEGEMVMAPGDREWAVAAKRDAEGIPIDFETAKFLGL